MARQALTTGAFLTYWLCPHCHALVLEAMVPKGNHCSHACLCMWPHTTGMTWGNPLTSLAPELIAEKLHVCKLPSVLHAVLATMTNATLLPSFLE